MTIQELYKDFKRGLFTASESVTLLQKKPVLLAYYAFLLLSYSVTYILAYNFFCHHALVHATFLPANTHLPNQQLLAEMLPTAGGLLYIGCIFSIILNIFLRSFFGVALIIHTMALVLGKTGSIGSSLKTTSGKWFAILKWSLCVTAITFALQLIAAVPLPKFTWHIVALLGLVWSLASFFVLPIIARQTIPIINALKQSIILMLEKLIAITGGMFWIGLLYTLCLFILGLIQWIPFVPTAILLIIQEGFIFGLNILAITAVLIFKTKLYVSQTSRPETQSIDEQKHHISHT